MIRNSLKYSINGHIQIGASVDSRSKILQIDVTDNGVDLAYREKGHLVEIFEPGFDLAKIEEASIGLLICRYIVKGCGGQISVRQNGNNAKGVTYSFSMKIFKSPDVEVSESSFHGTMSIEYSEVLNNS